MATQAGGRRAGLGNGQGGGGWLLGVSSREVEGDDLQNQPGDGDCMADPRGGAPWSGKRVARRLEEGRRRRRDAACGGRELNR